MKIRYLSDLHYGVNSIPHLILPPQPDEKILILAGDVMDGGIHGVDHIRQACRDFETVILVMGNHEYYHNSLRDGVEWLKGQFLFPPDNLHVWDTGVFETDTFGIVGATLWTDLNGMDWFAVRAARQGMPDFQKIGSYLEHKLITTDDWYDIHNKHLAYIDLQCKRLEDAGKKAVVVTHFAPSCQSTPPFFQGSPLNPCFVSNLDQFILDRPNIKYWIHGHIHTRHDYVIGNTNILCNPAGYRGELYSQQDLLQYDPNASIEL